MDSVEYTSRTSVPSHRSKRTKRPRSDGSSYAAYNGSDAQPTPAEDRTVFGDARFVPSSPQVQTNIPRQSANGEPMEASPTKSFIFKLYE